MSADQPFTPSGIITLTTDFGQEQPFVATMKGRILGRFKDARIIDLTHEIPVHWPVEAGFWLERSYHYFPPGTVHVAVVDPGVGTQRDIIAVLAAEQVFLAPDNGLLAPVVRSAAKKGVRIFRLDLHSPGRFGLTPPSMTFHGRDIFAPIAAELAAGRCSIADLGPTIDEIVPGWLEEPTVGPWQVTGLVVAIDHFGNLITNIDRATIQRFRGPIVRTGNHEFALRRTYGEVKPGEYLALINSFDVVEIARAEQSAAEGLGLGRGAPVTVVETIAHR